MKKNVIASLNGISNVGGVEKVTFYLSEILKTKFKVKVITRIPISFIKFDD